ncbi:MAG: hypothetical protein ACOCT0_03440 [Halobacteriota archaeon]
MALDDYLLEKELVRESLETEEVTYAVTSRRLVEYRAWPSPSTEEDAEWMRDLSVEEIAGIELSTEPRRGLGAVGRLLATAGIRESYDEVEATVEVHDGAGDALREIEVTEGCGPDDLRRFAVALRKAALTARQDLPR